MAAKKKIEVEVEVSETPTESVETPTTEAVVEVRENDKPILVAEPETPPASQIFGPAVAEPPAANKTLFWILITAFALLGVVAGGVGVYLQNRRSIPTVVASPQPSPAAAATPTPAVELNREDLSIQVLNGSGVTGAAATAADYLEELGYTDVAVGNAGSSNFTVTQIAIKDSQKSYLSLITADLGSKYTLADEPKGLAEDGPYDVVITIGIE